MLKNFFLKLNFHFRDTIKILLYTCIILIFSWRFLAEKDGRGEERGERHPKIALENWERAP